MSTHACPECQQQTDNTDLCDDCGIKLMKKQAAEAKRKHERAKGNGQGKEKKK